MNPSPGRAAAHVLVEDLDVPSVGEDDLHHLRDVLRLNVADEVSVTDGRGGWRMCRMRGSGGSLEAAGETFVVPRPVPSLVVGFVPVKGDRPDWAVQKLTELGIDKIVLLSSERSVVRWEGARCRHHVERLQRVSRQALMQSRGIWLPEVCGVEPVASFAGQPAIALAAPGGVPPGLDRPTVLVGPEGGWTARELASLPAVGLGPLVLRTETAAVAAGAILSAMRAGLVTQASLPLTPPPAR